MTKPNTALLRIRPYEYYFFGGETTFGNGPGANYFARSNPMPQQTTLLGLLRKALYDAKLPIGESFHFNRPVVQQYGVITGLSPVFLQNDHGQGWLPHALDAHPAKKGCKEEEPFTAFKYSNQRAIGESFSGLRESEGWAPAPYFEGADPKKEPTDAFVSQNGDLVKREDLFKSFVRIGITKFRRGNDPKERLDAFYKQEMYQLAAGWSFAVIVTLENGVDAKRLFHDRTVMLGGEKCLARMTLEQAPADFGEMFQARAMYKDRAAGQVVLVSDACVDDEFWSACAASVAETAPFRNIITPVETGEYGPMKPAKNAGFLYKSNKINLLKSGSVLYAGAGGTSAIADRLTAPVHFRQIGYNHFLEF